MTILRRAPEFPEKLRFLFDDRKHDGTIIRWKVAFGGRDASKSWSFARALLIQGAQRTKRILCAREIQKTISESVHRLLADQIQALALQDFYEVSDAIISGRPRTTADGTDFLFTGLRHVDADKIKSYEGVDIAWVEEARNLSKTSLRTLENTIRKDGSQIWLSFNPLLKEDEVYKRFVLNPPPPDAVVVKINFNDNPWSSEVLRVGREELKRTDPDEYAHVWEGAPRQNLEGAVYAKELRQARADGRICRVPYDRARPVDTFWDLGKRDHTSIWFGQFIGFEYRILDFYQNRGQPLGHYLKALQERGYLYGLHFLPHDADQDRLGAVKTISQQFRDAYPGQVRVLPRLDVNLGINAVRTIFPNCYFDEEKTADGLQCLGDYRYEVDEHTGAYSRLPLHDENSDAADAFRQLAVALREHRRKPKADQKPERTFDPSARGLGWMGT